MLEILTFIFGSFWRWAGTVILILAAGAILPTLVRVTIHRGGDDE